MFFRSATGRDRFVRPSQTSRIEKSSLRTSILPLSILARSRMSLIIASSILPDDWMLPAYRRCRSLSCSVPERTSEKPMIELSGVRSSWLMVARKSLFSRFISKSARLAWASSSTLRSRSLLTSRSSCCMATRL